MDYSIKINEFEGPLDLLLHLIKKSNANIYDISIEKITKDYLDYINKMEELNINVAASYLVMAAELMEIKSKSLLPQKERENTDEIDEEVSRENLINKLTLYKKYKEMMPIFKTLEEDRQKIYIKSPENIKQYIDNERLEKSDSVSAEDLFAAFTKFLERKKLEKPLNTKITTKEYSVKERKHNIMNTLKSKKKVELADVLDDYSKPFLIVTFISILEMAKENKISISQDHNFDKIILELRD